MVISDCLSDCGGFDSRLRCQVLWAVIELGFLAALQAVIGGFDSHTVHQSFTESNAAALVRRRALKTRFLETGWGSTPLLSAKFYGSMVESGLWHLSRKQATRKGSWVQILLLPPFL